MRAYVDRVTKGLFVVALALAVSVPSFAHAGVFSFIASFFTQEASAEATTSTVNTQNVGLLEAAINPDPNPAKGGGDITVVGGVALLSETGPIGTLADIEDAHSDTISLYVVRRGDTLGAIAKMFGVTTNTIRWANDITGGIIQPGQTLVILPITGVRHTVVKGDTVQSIAKKYKADLNEIMKYNDIEEATTLAIGEVVVVPEGEVAPPSVARSSSTGRPATLRGAGGPDLDGYYIRPIIGGKKTKGLHGYNGVDMASYLGAPILASASGQVIIARGSGWNGGYGNYIVVAHANGTQTLYAHLSSIATYEGKQVVRGEIIGYMGSTGRSTGTHLHFEVRGAKNPF